MKSTISRLDVLICAALGLIASGRALAEDYWSYVYKDFEVITPGGTARAVSMAHDLSRFDIAVTRILNLPDARVPTHVYELSSAEAKRILGEADVSSYWFDGFDVSVVAADDSHNGPNRYWGALFGYTGSLMMSGAASRYPFWLHLGLPQLFSHTEFDSDKIRTGGVVPGYAALLQDKAMIPTSTLLNVTAGDPRLKEHAFMEMFQAESWYLAREIYVEGKFRPEFAKYFSLIADGKTPADAFPVSFGISYEELDSLIRRSMKDPQHLYVVQVPQETAGSNPVKLSEAEMHARLAELAMHRQQWDYARQLVTDALEKEPDNARALCMSAFVALHDKNAETAAAAARKVAAMPNLSPEILTDIGHVLARLARNETHSQSLVPSEASSLLVQARSAYERAVQLDSQYLPAWSALASLTAAQRDPEAGRALVKRVEPVFEKHFRSGALARSLAKLCADTAQSDCAFLYGEHWRQDAVTPADRVEADAFMARLNPLSSGAKPTAQ